MGRCIDQTDSTPYGELLLTLKLFLRLGGTLYIITVDGLGNRLLAILYKAFHVLIGAHVGTCGYLFVIILGLAR